MKDRLRANLQDDFLKHNVVFFIGSMLVAILNYIYHPIITRLLTVEDFGELQAYFSLIIQIGVISGVIGRIILNIKTNTDGDGDDGDVVCHLYSLSTIINGLLAFSLVLLSPYIAHLLNINGYIGLFLTAIIIFISFPLTVAKFELQARKQFKSVSITESITSFGKLLFAIMAIYLGGKTLGALFGFFIATVVGILYVYPKTKETIHYKRLTIPRFTPKMRDELKYGVLILIATSFTTFFFTSDILIIRYFFDTETAGLYAGIATIARVIIFATGSVAGVTIAHIKLRGSRIENHTYMNKSILIVTSIGGGILLLFTLFPYEITKILIGERFVHMASILPRLSLLMTITAITSLFVLYFLALRRYFLIPLLSINIVSIAIFTILWHNSPTEVVNALICGVLFSLVIQIIVYRLEPATHSYVQKH